MTDFDAGAATGAADYPRKVLDLFDAYVHGALDRRSFLNQCAAHVGGMVSATAVLAIALIAASRPRPPHRESAEARYESRAMNHEWG